MCPNIVPSVENEAVDTLSRKVSTLQNVRIELMGLERISNNYPDCRDFGDIYTFLTQTHKSTLIISLLSIVLFLQQPFMRS